MIQQDVSVALLCVLVSMTSASAYSATVILDQDTTIDAANSFPDPGFGADSLLVEIVDGPTGPTLVRLTDGGVIGGSVHVLDNSHLLMLGGRIEARTVVRGNATLTIAGGNIHCSAAQCATDDTAYVINVEEHGTINFHSGVIGTNLLLEDSAVANIFARSFVVDGELPSANANPTGVRIQGIYAGGESFDITIIRDIGTAQVFIHIVPEPSPWVLAMPLILAAACTRIVYWRRSLNSC